MDYSIKELEDNTAIVDLSGDIDVYSASDLKDAILSQVDFGAKRIVINMENVYYIDSSGIGVFISLLGSLKKINGKMAIIKITEPVKKVFELTKLNSYLPIYSTETEALEKL